eukprot:gene14673-biopygen8120
MLASAGRVPSQQGGSDNLAGLAPSFFWPRRPSRPAPQTGQVKSWRSFLRSTAADRQVRWAGQELGWSKTGQVRASGADVAKPGTSLHNSPCHQPTPLHYSSLFHSHPLPLPPPYDAQRRRNDVTAHRGARN